MARRAVFLLGVALLAAGCASYPHQGLAGVGRVVVRPAVADGGFRTMAVVAPYTQADIHHVNVALQTVDGATTLAETSVLNADLGNLVTFVDLKLHTTYRVLARAYRTAGPGELISTDDAASTSAIAVAANDVIPVTLRVKLIDRLFSGTGTSPGILVTPGEVVDASPGPAIVATARTYVVTTFAGATAGFVDESGTAARFSSPRHLVWLGSHLYVADAGNHALRKVTGGGTVTTIAGDGTAGWVDETGASARLNAPYGLAAGTDLVFGQAGDHRIRRATAAGVVTTLAGDGTAGFVDAAGQLARFSAPAGLAVDADGNVYVADRANHRIRKITPAGAVSTLAGGAAAGFVDDEGAAARFEEPEGLAYHDGALYVADGGNHRVRRIDLEDAGHPVTTVAGTGTAGHADGYGAAVRFRRPSAIAVDAAGNLFVTDREDHRIRRINAVGIVTTVAGSGTAGSTNGTGAAASFDQPWGLAFDAAGDLFVADAGNHRIRKIAVQ